MGADIRTILARIKSLKAMLGDDDLALEIALDALQECAVALSFYGLVNNHGSRQGYSQFGVKTGSPSNVEMDSGRKAQVAMAGIQAKLRKIEKALKKRDAKEEGPNQLEV